MPRTKGFKRHPDAGRRAGVRNKRPIELVEQFADKLINRKERKQALRDEGKSKILELVYGKPVAQDLNLDVGGTDSPPVLVKAGEVLGKERCKDFTIYNFGLIKLNNFELEMKIAKIIREVNEKIELIDGEKEIKFCKCKCHQVELLMKMPWFEALVKRIGE